jgi:hypothetical protein
MKRVPAGGNRPRIAGLHGCTDRPG